MMFDNVCMLAVEFNTQYLIFTEVFCAKFDGLLSDLAKKLKTTNQTFCQEDKRSFFLLQLELVYKKQLHVNLCSLSTVVVI